MKATATLRAWLSDGPFTLAMSSGFFGFFAHAGMLTGLLEAGYTPAAVRGSSAGALIGGLWAAGVDPVRLKTELLRLTRADFWDPRPGFGLLRGRLFEAKLRSLLPVAHVEQTSVPLAVSVFDVWGRRTEVRRRGDLAKTLRASCALPLLFQPVWIDGRPKLDGGVADRHGLHGAVVGERVLYHHLLPNSPWRAKTGRSVALPTTPGIRSLAITELPRVTPFRLEQGEIAFRHALVVTRRELAN